MTHTHTQYSGKRTFFRFSSNLVFFSIQIFLVFFSSIWVKSTENLNETASVKKRQVILDEHINLLQCELFKQSKD